MIVDGIKVKIIPGFFNYAISKDGRVWSKSRITSHGHKRTGRWLSFRSEEKGYISVKLWKKKTYKKKVHRLVLETYIGLCPNGMECRHLDGNPQNNNLKNLCWGTKSENQLDRFLHGTDSRGEKCGNAKLTKKQVYLIYNACYIKTYTQRELANTFNVSQSCIQAIASKKTWRHLCHTI